MKSKSAINFLLVICALVATASCSKVPASITPENPPTAITITETMATTTTVVTTAYSTMPDDFYIVYERESGIRLETLLNTKNNIIGEFEKRTFTGFYDYVAADYYISRDKLQGIYDFIIQHDIKQYNSSRLLTSFDDFGIRATVDPYYRGKITFCINGEVFSILYDATYIFASHMQTYSSGLYSFEQFLDRFCYYEYAAVSNANR